MLVAVSFALLMLAAGYAVVRVLRLIKGAEAAGLVPVAGLAASAILATWIGIARAPAPIAGVAILALGAAGLVAMTLDRVALSQALVALAGKHRLALVLIVGAIAIPIVSMGAAFWGVAAPLSTHDGAFHVETSDAFRRAAAVSTWYPPGLAALFGGVLQVLPWLDTAAGVFDFGLALSLLVPVAVFGLGVALMRNLVAASAAAVFVSLTHLVTYFPQIWSGWPQLIGILLVVGLWIVAARYLVEPSKRLAVMAGVLIAAVLLVHGTELYTSAFVLTVVAVLSWRAVSWSRLAPHLGGAIVVAAVCAAPYLPLLLQWAGTGGSYSVGYVDSSAVEQSALNGSALERLATYVSDSLGVDFPIRPLLIAAGTFALLGHHTGSTIMALAAVFVAMAIVASFLAGLPIIRDVYAATYPWSLPYRHLMFASVAFALLAGAGFVAGVRWWQGLLLRVNQPATRRRLTRLARLLVATWLALGTWAITTFLAIEARAEKSFVDDDAAAMAWLHDHVESDAIVINDAFADAGIWIPYKAGVSILIYRSFSEPGRMLVYENAAHLEDNPAAMAAACAFNARYLYRGAANTGWEARSFPSVETLQASPALEEAFAYGRATVFRVRLKCGGT